METSRLLLQSGEPYFLYSSNNIDYSIVNPKIKDIIELEKKENGLYYKYLYNLISTSLDVADVLFCEADIWYEDIKDEWEFFIQKIISAGIKVVKCIEVKSESNFKSEVVTTCCVIDNIYRDAFNFFFNTDGEYIICNIESNDDINNVYLLNVNQIVKREEDCYILDNSNFRLNKHYYNIMVDILKAENWIKPQYDFLQGGTKYAKKYILKHNYKERSKNKPPNVDLSSIISSLVAKGQNYNDIMNYSIYFVYDLYYRLIKIDEWNNVMMALNNGCINTKEHPIDYEKINWSKIIT